MTTIHDVAKKANVSLATVSNVYNKPNLVRESTRQRVVDAATELGYTPNLIAQGLRKGRSAIVGILVPDIRLPYAALLARGAMDMLKSYDQLAVVSNVDGDTDIEIATMTHLWQQGIRQFIVAPVPYIYSEKTIDFIHSLIEKQGVFAYIGAQHQETEVDIVVANAQGGAKDAVSHLSQLGHKRIAFIGGEYSKGYGLARYLGYQEGMLLNQNPIHDDYMIETIETSNVDGFSAAERLLALPEPPTAIFAINDDVAVGVMSYCYQQNIRIPDQLSVVGFNDTSMAQVTTPPLTTVALPIYEQGQKAAELLLQRIKQPELPKQDIAMACQLHKRLACGLGTYQRKSFAPPLGDSRYRENDAKHPPWVRCLGRSSSAEYLISRC